MRILLLILLSACTVAPCPLGTNIATRESLLFGTQRPDGVVSKAEFETFIAEIITPRFPDGLTISEASGQWRDSSNTIVRERSYVVHLIYRGDREDAIAAIVDEYKRRFAQEAVLRVRDTACAGF